MKYGTHDDYFIKGFFAPALIARFSLALVGLIALSGCAIEGGEEAALSVNKLLKPAPIPDHIVLVSGDTQTGSVAAALPIPVRVQIVDASGIPVPGVSIRFNATVGGGSVAPSSVTTDANGFASTSWTLGTIAGANTLSVDRNGTPLPGSPSTIAFNAVGVPAAPASLRIAMQPSSTAIAGAALSTQPQVEIIDAYGNRVPSATNAVMLEAYTDSSCSVPGSGTLGASSNPSSATSGLATFSGVSYTNAETIYLKANSSGLTSTCSTAVAVNPAAASKLVYSVQPASTGVAGASLPIQPVLQVQDSFGNVAPSGSYAVTLSAFTDSGCSTAAPGILLATTNPLATVSGSAAFSGVAHTNAQIIYLKAATAGLIDACSNGIAIAPAAANRLAFATQPSATASAGVSLPTQPIVRIEDAFGNLVSAGSHSVSLSATTDATCATAATGTFGATSNPVASANGISGFSGINYSKAETIYIRASASGLTQACSNAVAVGPAAAHHLVFSVQPSSSVIAAVALATQPVIQIHDAYGNLVTGSSHAVTLSATTDVGCAVTGTGTFGASVNPVTAVLGAAAFVGVNYSKAETIWLKASASGLIGACSNAVAVSVGPASRLVFSTQPSATATAGTAFAIQPVVRVTDAGGNFVATGAYPITIAAFSDVTCTTAATGTFSVTTNPVTSSGGISSFAGVRHTKSGNLYIRASATGLAAACSNAVAISSATASVIAFAPQPPAAAVAGAAFATQPGVEVRDTYGNRVTSSSLSITLAAFTNATCTTAALGTLSATTNPLAATSGLATFSGLNYTKAESIYLRASATGMTSICSTVVAVAAGSASRLAFSTQPSATATAGTNFATQPRVRVEDSFGNLVTTGAHPITLAAFTNAACTTAGTGTFNATTNPLTSASGAANFAGVRYTKAETIYIRASATGLTQACSNAVAVAAGAANRLAFFTPPSSLNRPTVNFGTQPVVEVRDAFLNRVTSSSLSITLAAFTNATCTTAATGSLTATTNPRAASAGLATFSGLKYSRSENIFVRASATGVTSVCSPAVKVGVDLEVPIELIDYGIQSLTTAQAWERTRTRVTVANYDGTLSYRFEVVCQNTDTSARSIGLVDSTNAVNAAISIPASTTNPTRFEVSFTPGTPVNYRVQTAATPTAGLLTCYAARVLIRQVYATKTEIYIPLMGAAYGIADNDTTVTGGVIDSATSTTAGQGAPHLYARFRKDSSAISGLATTTPWRFEAILSRTGGTSARAALYTAAGAAVTGGEMVQTATTPTLTSLAIADNATNFSNATDFEVRIRSNSTGTTSRIYKAGLYVLLANIIKTQVPYRIARSANTSSNLVFAHQRTAINTSWFYSPTINFEATGYEPTVGTSDIDLKTAGTTDSGLVSTLIPSSSLNPNSTGTIRSRSAALSIADGDRFIPELTCSSGSIVIKDARVLVSTP